jgi:hypothetical protein
VGILVFAAFIIDIFVLCLLVDLEFSFKLFSSIIYPLGHLGVVV